MSDQDHGLMKKLIHYVTEAKHWPVLKTASHTVWEIVDYFKKKSPRANEGKEEKNGQ
jgi:hypothetical protein